MSQSSRKSVTITTQIFEDMKQFILVSRILGLAPVACEKKGNSYVLSISYKYIAYSYILALFIAGTALFALITDIISSGTDSLRIDDTKDAYVVSGDIGLMIFIVILGIFISPFKLGKFFQILESLKHVQTKINVRNHEHTRKMFLRISSVSFIILLTVLVYDFIAWCLRTKGLPSAVHLWKNAPLYLLYIVSFTQEISFWQMTFFVKRCFFAFNEYLKGSQQMEEIELHKTQLFNISKNVTKKQSGEKRCFQIGTHLLSDRRIIITQKNLTAEKVEGLIHVYRMLFEMVNLINDWYEIPLLFVLLSCLLQLIGTPYFIITNTQNKLLIFSILEIVWLFIHAARVMIIIEASHSCIKEYEKIHYLLCNHLEKDYDNDTIHRLKILALHVNTCKIKFSTYGITDLNRSILASITGAVTTYLVVLVQLNTDPKAQMTVVPLTTKIVLENSSNSMQ